jgi:hypothetical protein
LEGKTDNDNSSKNSNSKNSKNSKNKTRKHENTRKHSENRPSAVRPSVRPSVRPDPKNGERRPWVALQGREEKEKECQLSANLIVRGPLKQCSTEPNRTEPSGEWRVVFKYGGW